MLENLINKATKGLKTASLVGAMGWGLVACGLDHTNTPVIEEEKHISTTNVLRGAIDNMYFTGNLGFLRMSEVQVNSGRIKVKRSPLRITYHNQTNYASFKHHKDFKAPDTYNIFLSNANQPIGDKIGTMELIFSETNGNEVESTYVPKPLGAKKDNIVHLIESNQPDLGYLDAHADFSKWFKINNNENKIYHTVSELNFDCNIKDHPHEIVFKGKVNKDPRCSGSSTPGLYAVLNSQGQYATCLR